MNQFNLTVGLRRIGITQPLGLSWLLGQDRRGGGAAEPGNRGTEARGRGDGDGGGAGRADLGRAEAGRADTARQQLNSLTGAAEKNGAWPPKAGRRRTGGSTTKYRGAAENDGACGRTGTSGAARRRRWRGGAHVQPQRAVTQAVGTRVRSTSKKKVGFARSSKKKGFARSIPRLVVRVGRSRQSPIKCLLR
jgi:hypothetical protein